MNCRTFDLVEKLIENFLVHPLLLQSECKLELKLFPKLCLTFLQRKQQKHLIFLCSSNIYDINLRSNLAQRWPHTNILTSSFQQKVFNSLTSMSDQDRISPYNINTVSSRQVMRINKNIN